MSQERLAHKAKWKEGTYIQHFESGKRLMPIPRCVDLAEITGIPLRLFLGRQQRAIMQRAYRLMAQEDTAA